MQTIGHRDASTARRAQVPEPTGALANQQHSTLRMGALMRELHEATRFKPRWGAGLPVSELGDATWQTHLAAERSPQVVLALLRTVCFGATASMPLESMRWEECLEGVRRLMSRADPLRPLRTSAYASESDATLVLKSLVSALPPALRVAMEANRDPARKMVPHFPMLNAGLPILRPVFVAQGIRLAYSAVPPLLRLLGGVASCWARTSAGGLFYLDSGEPPAMPGVSSPPPLLLLHGLHTTSACWAPLVLELAHTRRVLAPDLLDYDFGFSRSSDEETERRATFEQHVASAGELIAALGVKVPRPAHFVTPVTSRCLARPPCAVAREARLSRTHSSTARPHRPLRNGSSSWSRPPQAVYVRHVRHVSPSRLSCVCHVRYGSS